jgi:VanZ family protein
MMQHVATLLRLVPVAVAMGIIFFLSHQPGDSLSLPRIPGIDKVAHMVVYAFLAATILASFSDEQKHAKPKRVLWLTVLLCLVYAISDEFHQSFVLGRTSSFFDVFADCTGATLTSVLWFRWRKRIARIGSWKNCFSTFLAK